MKASAFNKVLLLIKTSPYDALYSLAGFVVKENISITMISFILTTKSFSLQLT